MGAQWTPVVLLAAFLSVQGFQFDDEQYYEMPRLFELDDWQECLASRRGAYCLGSFDLLHHTNDRLMNLIQNFSSDKFHFNHTHIHRGVCVSSRCPGVQGPSLRARFERCVQDATRARYGLRTNLTALLYCRPSKSPGPHVEVLDVAFAYVVGAVLLMNLVGTAYDVWRNKEDKPNKYLITWSLIVNWGRLTANYSEGDPRLSALKPVQGMKVLTLLLIMMAHSVLAYHITYLYNPEFFEKSSHQFMSAYFQNGTSIVQTFIMVSSFLMAYNLLLYADADADPKRKLTLKLFPRALVHRITRISPVYLFVLGFSVSWWARLGEGPLWGPLVGGECARCRDKWWTQALFLNNFIRPDVRCLIHTWFLAVDMQLYVVSALLTLAMGRNLRIAMKVIVGLFFTSILANFLAAFYFELRPMVTLMFPEHMRLQFEGERSFNWLYQAPWDSFPAAMVGLFVAFLHYHLQEEGCKPADSLTVRVLYRASVPAMFLWVVCGYFVKEVTAPLPVALYAAIDRPVFTSLTALAMLGFFNKIDSLWWRFLSWRGWEVLGRLALPAYLVHWPVALTLLAYRHYLSPVSVHEIGGHFLWTVFMSYWLALPLHLLVELPLMKFLQAVLS